MPNDAHADHALGERNAARDRVPPMDPLARRSLRALLLVGLVAAAAALFRALAVECLEEDGQILVEAAALRRGGQASWYHAAYMQLEALIELFVGVGRAFDALLWSSALSAAVGLAVVALALRPSRGGEWLPLLALACSPGLLVQATRIEVHALQFLGAAVLLHAVYGRAPRALAHVFGAALFAVVCHRTNLGLVPGAAWLALSSATSDRRVRVALVVVAGAAVGHLFNLSTPEQAGSANLDVWLVLEFWRGPSASHVWRELVVPWFPVLVVVGLHAARFDRRSWPFAVATLPLAAFFSLFGVGTSGGYFTGVCVFAAAAVADVRSRGRTSNESAAPSAPLRRALVVALVAAACSAGVAVGVTKVRAPERHELARIGAQRHADALAVLPRGGVLVCVDPSYQSVAGRTPGLEEMNLVMSLLRNFEKATDPDVWAGHCSEIVGDQIALDLEIALDREWLVFTQFDPRLGAFIAPLETLMRERHGFVEETHGVRAYLVRRTPTSGAAVLDTR